MEIHQLKTFVAVAREGSITRASERLFLSQPAVSAHIKAIEDMLGLTLFERTPRGMSLTTDGQRLLAKAEQTLGAHRELLEEAARMKGRLSGRLRLGAGGAAGAQALGRLLTALSDRCPEVEVALRHAASLDVLKGVLDGNLDAGFYAEAGVPDATLSTIEVVRFGVFLAAPPGLVAPSTPTDWRALAAFPWVCPTASTCCGKIAETLFETHGFRPERIISIDREDVMRTLIAGGVGIGLLHATVADEARRSGDVDILCEAQETVRVLFAHRSDRAQDPVIAVASAILRDHAQAAPA